MYMCGICFVNKNGEWDLMQFLSHTEEEIPFVFGENYKTTNFIQIQSDFFWQLFSEIKNASDIVDIQFEGISHIENFGGVYSHNEFHKF